VLPEDSVESAKRGANTESLVRAIIERVENLNENGSGHLIVQDWICECADDTCVERIALSLGEYEQVRANPVRFVVAPSANHVFEEIEEVVEKTGRFWLVGKHGTAGEVAASMDPQRAR
jgi:hypothetical protein